MLGMFTEYFAFIFGPQPYEKKLSGSKNVKILKLLDITSKVRFVIFPIAFCIWVLGFVLELIMIALEWISRFLHFAFESLNDSLWVNLSWFDLTEEELDKEVAHLNEKA